MKYFLNKILNYHTEKVAYSGVKIIYDLKN